MQLHRAFDAPHYPAVEVFRQSRLVAVLGTLPVVVVVGLLVAFGIVREAPGVFWIFPAAVGLTAVFLARVALASFRPSNWLVRYSPDGMLIQIRSHLNAHLPAEDQTILYLPTSEIASANKLVERVAVQTPRGRERRTCIWLELRLGHDQTHGLAQALVRERTAGAPGRRLRSRWRHHPVELSEPDRLRILWRSPNTWIRPGVDRALALLAERVPLAPERRAEIP